MRGEDELKFFIGDLLACPVCKSTNLLIHPIEVVEEEAGPDPEKVKCKRYCHYLRRPASEVDIETCRVCVRKRIKTGVIVCLDCGRWYPIEDTIAYMLSDEYRDEKHYAKWLERHIHELPGEVAQHMKIPDVNKLRGGRA